VYFTETSLPLYGTKRAGLTTSHRIFGEETRIWTLEEMKGEWNFHFTINTISLHYQDQPINAL